MNILFTCAGRRNYLINYFKEALGNKGKVIAADSNLLAPALADADLAVQLPSIYEDNYIDELAKILKDNDVNAVISLNDLELPILSANKDKLESESCKVIVSSGEVIDIGFDKWETYRFINRAGLKSPRTYIDLEKAKKDMESGIIKFPLVLKPRWGSASIGIEFPESMEELELSYKLLKIKLKRTVLNEASQKAYEESILIQEKVDGIEYGMDVLNDFTGTFYGSYAREKIGMRAGETDKAESVIDPKLSEVGRKIGENLGHIGNLDCDVFLTNEEVFVLELNPRFGGGYPFSHESGVNTAAIYIAWLEGTKDVDEYDEYKSGKLFSKCDRLIEIGKNRD